MSSSVPSGWAQTDKALTRTIQRASFIEALALVMEIGKLAEAADHHPDIDIRYRTVHLSLSTHSAGSTVTQKDFDLAEKINDLNEDVIRLGAVHLRGRFQI